MSVTTTCRDVAQLKQVAQTAVRLLFQECYKAGIKNIFITETYRSKERQKYLYAQGRTRPGQVVTWTLESYHASRLAWDIACSSPSLYDVATLNRVGAIAKKLGITWGGSWKNNIDRPHFEVKDTWKIPKGYKLEGTVIVPSNSKMKVQLIVSDTKNTEPIKETENMLNETGRKEIRELLKKARNAKIISDKHTDAKINAYTDMELLSYQAAVTNRTFK